MSPKGLILIYPEYIWEWFASIVFTTTELFVKA
jgi:hypothetical protein